MAKRFIIVIPKEDGGLELYAMKEWLRQHPDRVPPGTDATASTSHRLRDGLRSVGWTVQELESETRLIMPGAAERAEGIESVLGGTEESESAAGETTFALEHQLRDFLAQNLAAIAVEGKTLRLYVDPTGRDGIEYPTAVGRIDILALDNEGAFYVFELKRAKSPDSAVGQLTRYMGWVQHTIGKGHDIRGVVVAKSIDDKLRYAASVIPNVSLLEYEVEFHLTKADQIPSDSEPAW